jgi:uncharacterized membrane protein
VYFDGSDVGLTTNGEDVNAITLAENGALVVSTVGNFNVPGISGSDEDLIALKYESLGGNTSGEWHLFFDGSRLDLDDTADEAVWGSWYDTATKTLYLTTRGDYSIPNSSGTGADVFSCSPLILFSLDMCPVNPGLFWDGSAHGFGAEKVDGLAIDLSPTSPTIGFKADPISGDVPLSVYFEGGSFGYVTEWLWDFGDGFTGSGKIVTHTYNTPGVYTVTLTGNGPTGSGTLVRNDFIVVGKIK